MKKFKRIGILGGSFDPVHAGHLRLAQTARSHLGLAQVYFVPTFQTPLKRSVQTARRHRIGMLKAALKSKRFAKISLFEIKRKRMSYTIYTLKYFKRRLGRNVELYFLVGGDVPKQLSRWRARRSVMKLCTFAVAPRPGYALPKGFIKLPMRPIRVTSTDLRARLKKRLVVRGAMPQAVVRYIHKHKLYQT